MQVEYKLIDPNVIDTPAMLTYPHIVEQNIDEIIRICGLPENVVPHAKTHKSSDVLNMQIKQVKYIKYMQLMHI